MTYFNEFGQARLGWNIGTPSGGGGNSIITNGLILNLDAGNSTSYPGTGTQWTDLSGNNRNGTLVNGVGYSSSNGGALTFDGVVKYLSIANMSSALVNKTKFSYETWVKCNNTNHNGTIFSFGGNNEFNNDVLLLLVPNGLLFQINNGSDGGATISFTSTTWNHIGWVFDGTQSGNSNRMKVYVNGVQQTLDFSTYNVPASTSPTNFVNCSIGNYATAGFNYNYFNGLIGLSRLYSTSLSVSDVLQNFNATKTRFGL
jgi:hypothetical protein